jgi:hypothetical protein
MWRPNRKLPNTVTCPRLALFTVVILTGPTTTMPSRPLAIATNDSIYIINPRSSLAPTRISCLASPIALAWSARSAELYACSRLGIHQLSLETLEWTKVIESKTSEPQILSFTVRGDTSPRVGYSAGSEISVWDQRRQRGISIAVNTYSDWEIDITSHSNFRVSHLLSPPFN